MCILLIHNPGRVKQVTNQPHWISKHQPDIETEPKVWDIFLEPPWLRMGLESPRSLEETWEYSQRGNVLLVKVNKKFVKRRGFDAKNQKANLNKNNNVHPFPAIKRVVEPLELTISWAYLRFMVTANAPFFFAPTTGASTTRALWREWNPAFPPWWHSKMLAFHPQENGTW